MSRSLLRRPPGSPHENEALVCDLAFSLGGVISIFGFHSAFAAPTIADCSAGNNPYGSTASCSAACGWEEDATGTMSCDLQDFCATGVGGNAWLVRNSTTAATNDYAFHAECGAVEVCCVMTESVRGEVDSWWLRGTDEDDKLFFSFASGDPERLTPTTWSPTATLSREVNGPDAGGKISGEGGNDYIIGSNEGGPTKRIPETLYGGNGHDILFGGAGQDELDGGDGADWINSWTGISGALGADRDKVTGGAGGDLLIGHQDNDLIYGDGGDDVICGDDSPTAHPVPPTLPSTVALACTLLSGADGDDEIYGGGGDDFITASDGDDTIYGGIGDDTIEGNDGDDQIDAGAGFDLINGDAGDDAVCDTFDTMGADILLGADDDKFFISGISGSGTWDVDGGTHNNGDEVYPSGITSMINFEITLNPATCPF